MAQQVKAFGQVLQFPDGMTEDQMAEAIRYNEPSLNPNYKKPLTSRINEFAKDSLGVGSEDITNAFGQKKSIADQAEGRATEGENTATGKVPGAPVRQSFYNKELLDQTSLGNETIKQPGALGRVQSAAQEDIKGQVNQRELEGLRTDDRVPEGGFVASAKSMAGQTIKGAGQIGADYFDSGKDNALIEYGNEILRNNPLAVKSLEDIKDQPFIAFKEASGNMVPSFGAMLGTAALGQGIMSVAPLTGPAAPVVAAVGVAVKWLGPAAIAALPSYSGIRDKQIFNDKNNEDSSKAKAIALLGASAVGAIEVAFGPQNWAITMLTKEGRVALARKFAATTPLQAFAKGAAIGGLSEGSEELAQNPIEQLSAFEDPTTKENLKETAFGGVMGFIGGVLPGGVINTAGFISQEAQSRADRINAERQKLGLEKIRSAETVDDAIQAANETVSTKPIDKEDVLKSVDPTLVDIERLTGLKPSEAIQAREDILKGEQVNEEQATGQADGAILQSPKETEIVLPDNTTVKAQWDIVDADSVKASLKSGESQPRDRTRATSDLQINSISKNPDYRRLSDSPVMDIGAPVLSNDGQIVGGNGRFEALSRAYEQGTSQEYIDRLRQDAINKGIDPAVLDTMSKPVLVRRISQPFDTKTLAIASNSGTSLQYSALEQANIDSDRMKGIENLDVTDSGDIALTPKNITQLKDSLESFTSSELGSLVDKGGQLSQEGIRRVRNAMLAKAYGNTPVLEKIIESTDTDMRNVLGALTRSAGTVAQVRSNAPKELDITDKLLIAVNTLSQIKGKGQTLDSYLAQDNIFGDNIDPDSKEILQFLNDNIRSQKKLTEFIKEVYSKIGSIDQSTDDIFGDNTLPTKAELIQNAKQTTGKQAAEQADIFSSPNEQESKAKASDAGSGKESKPTKGLRDVRISKLEKHLKDNGYDFTIEPAGVRDIDALDSTKKARKELAEKQAKLFKKKVVFVKADGPFRINGVMAPSIADTIFVDIRTDKSFNAVMAHELSHWMEQEKPEVYKSMLKSLKKVIVEDASEGYAKKYGIEGAAKSELNKEIAADIMGDNFTEESFWNKVAEANPQAFRDISATVIKWLKGIILKAKSNGMGSEQWVKDAAKAQDIIAKAVAQYTENDAAPVSADGKPKFHKVFHGSPHDHNKFDSSKIGTGEGSQAYGYGHYLSSSAAVAQYYRDNLSGNAGGEPLLIGVMPSSGNERISDITRRNLKDLAQELISNTGITKLFSEHNVVTQNRMLSDMVNLLHDSKVLDSVVRLVPVDVVNMLSGKKLSRDMLLHDPSMLIDLLPVNSNNLVPGSIEAVNILAPVVAISTAEVNTGLSILPHVWSSKNIAAITADGHKILHEITSKIPHPSEFINKKGKLYEVELAPEQDEYLLWDEPLSKQSDKVKAALSEIDFPVTFRDSYKAIKEVGSDPFNPKTINIGNGNEFYSELAKNVGGSKAASEYLHSIGIRGIKYLDGISRGKGEGAYNYVVFDDKDISITAKFSRAEKELDDYRMEHRSPGREGNAPLSDLTGDGNIYPDDVYSSKAVQYYGTGDDVMDRQSFNKAKLYRGKPDAMVEIYRAVPKGVASTINPGDWVTINKNYAKEHGESYFDGKYDILSKKVKAGDIFTNGDSIHEWGYEPESDINFSRSEKTIEVDGIERPTTNSEGKQIHATEEGIRNFWKWFSDSKVVDDYGRPKVVYHGTDKTFNKINTKKGTQGIFWFSSDKETIESGNSGAMATDKIMPLYVKIDQPANWKQYDDLMIAEFKSRGLDGAILPRKNNQFDGFVLDGSQVKSSEKNTGDFSKENNDIRFSFAGPKAETADKYALETAQQRIEAGDNADTVRQETGWFKGVDDKWRFEINDVDASIKKPFPSKGQRFGDVYKSVHESKLKEGYAGIALGDVLNHPKLFAAYPQLEYLSIDTQKGSGASFRVSTSLSPSMIEIGGDVPMYEVKSVLLHEIQHGIQRIEGFANGGSANDQSLPTWKDIAQKINDRYAKQKESIQSSIKYKQRVDEIIASNDLPVNRSGEPSIALAQRNAEILANTEFGINDLEDARQEEIDTFLNRNREANTINPRYAGYERLAGEVEARNTQSRIGMSDAARKSISPSSTQDVPDSDQIIVYNGVEMRSEPEQPKKFNPNEDIPETKFRKAQRVVQDKFNRFTVVKEFLAKQKDIVLSENADVYKAEERYHAKVANQLEDFREGTRNPLVEKIAKAGFKLDQVEEYLLNNHAQEANAQNRKLTGKDDSTAYGISDQEAKDYLAKAPKELAKLADEVQAITKTAQQLRLDNGIENQERVDAMNGAYKYYVPVRGDAESQEKQSKGQGTGQGYGIKYKGKRRLGHEARNEAVIDNIFQDYERAVIQVEKNRVAKSLALMAAEIQMPELISIDRPVKRKVLQNQKAFGVLVKGDLVDVFQTQEAANQNRQLLVATDKKLTLSDITIAPITDQRLIYSASPMLADNEVLVYMDGHELRLQINDDILARAYKNMGTEALGSILSVGRAMNGWMSKVYTGYNPEFIFTNLQRDFQSGIINLTGEQGALIAAKAVANYPKAFATLLKYAATGKSTEWIDSYRDNGGNTGAAYLPDLERLGTEVRKEYASYQGVIANLKEKDAANALRAAGRKTFNATLKYIEYMNQAGENAFRLATFKAMVDSGKSVKEAASMAKNVTVNFNRKGEIGAEINALYLFFNASVQGTSAVSHALFKGRHKYQAWGLVGGMMTLGYIMASALGGFDDEDKYDEISDQTKSRNLIMSYGDGYTKIPVPYGHGFFYNAGRMFAEAQRKGELGKMPYQLTALATEEFSPFNVASTEDGEFNSKKVVYGLFPSVPSIPLEIATNFSRFTGRELYPEKDWYKSEPDNEKMWRGTKGTVYDITAQYLASIGVAEISPETLKHITRAATGGTGAFVDSTISAAMLKKEGAELDTREMPFVRKMYGEATIQDKRARFGKIADEARIAKEKLNAAKRDNDLSSLEKVIKDKSELLYLNEFANKTSEVIKIFRDEQDSIKLSDNYTTAEKRLKIKELEREEEGFYKMFFDEYKKIDRSKLN